MHVARVHPVTTEEAISLHQAVLSESAMVQILVFGGIFQRVHTYAQISRIRGTCFGGKCFQGIAACNRFQRKIKCRATVIHFYFGADLISVLSVQAFFTWIKSLPKFCNSRLRWGHPNPHGQAPSKFSPYRNGEFSLYRKVYATKIKVDNRILLYILEGVFTVTISQLLRQEQLIPSSTEH